MARLPTVLALIDVPNINAQVYEVENRRPPWADISDWLRRYAEAAKAQLEPWAYLNQEVDPLDNRWETQEHLRHVGIKTHLHQKVNPSDDVDDLMVHKFYEVWDSRNLTDLIIFSHDMRNFAHTVREAEIAGINVVLVGFPNFMGRRFLTPVGAVEHKLVDIAELRNASAGALVT